MNLGSALSTIDRILETIASILEKGIVKATAEIDMLTSKLATLKAQVAKGKKYVEKLRNVL